MRKSHIAEILSRLSAGSSGYDPKVAGGNLSHSRENIAGAMAQLEPLEQALLEVKYIGDLSKKTSLVWKVISEIQPNGRPVKGISDIAMSVTFEHCNTLECVPCAGESCSDCKGSGRLVSNFKASDRHRAKTCGINKDTFSRSYKKIYRSGLEYLQRLESNAMESFRLALKSN